MGKRLLNWTYYEPYYYMVTIKRCNGLPPLSRLDAKSRWGVDVSYPLTNALGKTVREFLAKSPGIETITPYVIMPDHLHLLIKLNDRPERLSLIKYVDILKRLLTRTFREQTGIDEKVFESDWHDLIVKKANQLDRFFKYILNNPKMAMLRQQNRNLFHCYRGYKHWRFGDAVCDLVGNPELVDEPVFLNVRVSRSVVRDSPEWKRLEELYGKWRPGGTAVGTWWSQGEKMVAAKILENGGNIVYLLPDGFGERWHPPGEFQQKLCAEGRLLYLSPYPAHSAKLPPGETRRRCLELNAFAKAMAER